jgi:hypothetical protein
LFNLDRGFSEGDTMRKGTFFALYTTPSYAAHGIVESVSGSRVSVKHQICFTQCVDHFATQTFQVPDGAVVRYEGRDATPAEALAPERFLRFVAPREQIVQAISSSVRLRADQVEATIDNGRRPREGHLACMDGRDLLMVEQLPSGCRDIRVSADNDVSGHAWLLDGQYTPRGAAQRAGDRTLTCPDGFIGVDSCRAFLIPGDEGIVEGVVKSFDGTQLVVTTQTSPTGKAVDCVTSDVTVRVDPDALIDINGLKGFSAVNPPDPTPSFRFFKIAVLRTGGVSTFFSEVKIHSNGRIYGADMRSSGDDLAADGDESTKVWVGKSGELILDLGEGNSIQPDKIELLTSENKGFRGILEFELLGARPDYGEGALWVPLHHHGSEHGPVLPKGRWAAIDLDLSTVNAAPVTVENTIVPGCYVRVLPFLANGAVFVRDNARTGQNGVK